LVAQFPAAPAYRHELTKTHNNLGNLWRELGKRPQAEEQLRKALALVERLAADFPTVPEYRRDLGNAHTNLGNVFMVPGQLPQAEEQYHKALVLQEKLAAEFPAVTQYQVDLGSSYCNLGIRFLIGGQPEAVLPWLAKAIRTLTGVYEQDRQHFLARTFLRNSHQVRAEAYTRLRKFAEAVKDWDKVIELIPPEEQPGFRVRRAIARHHAGQSAEAVAEVAELAKHPSWPAGVWYDFACVYAVASGKLTAKQTAYADRAMELLHKAVQAGYNDAAHLKQDTDLDFIRGRDDFKKLVAALEKQAKTKSTKQP
jgi:hypothetical protein